MKDRYKLHQFYQNSESTSHSLSVQEFTDEVYQIDKLNIATLAMDLPGKTPTQRQRIETIWIDKLPTLDNIRALSVRHRVKQDFFNAICKMKNLESLTFWLSTVEDISNITRLIKLKDLRLCGFSKLKDISSLMSLNQLTVLSIDNCFAIENYEVLGEITQLVGLQLCGDSFAPKNLQLKSLKPLETLKSLKHLDLSSTSVVDKSYESILEMTNLERFDISVTIPKMMRERIKTNHKALKAGFFIDYDFDNKKFYNDKQW